MSYFGKINFPFIGTKYIIEPFCIRKIQCGSKHGIFLDNDIFVAAKVLKRHLKILLEFYFRDCFFCLGHLIVFCF